MQEGHSCVSKELGRLKIYLGHSDLQSKITLAVHLGDQS